MCTKSYTFSADVVYYNRSGGRNKKKEKGIFKMTTFFDYLPQEQELIRKAYEWEMKAIETESTEGNPYADTLKFMGLWDALNDAIEMAFN